MLKTLWFVMLLGGSVAASASGSIDAFKQSRKVVVDTAKAELCFADNGQCHPVLVGKTTPKGLFDMKIYKTDKRGYGGDIIGFSRKRIFCLPCTASGRSNRRSAAWSASSRPWLPTAS